MINTTQTNPRAAPGARVVVRDAEWLVRRVDSTSTGGQQLTCVGISEPVHDKEAIFLSELEEFELLNSEKTGLVIDSSASFRASLLYMESLLRRTAPVGEVLYTGHKGAMDLVPFQLEPAIQALEQPRQRILIADAVGLGKTLEAGILVSELIKRGKGKRILVVAVKSMLTQFQKEFWCRFTIPLTRLDSIGIQRIRHLIPTNQNPFYYYDKAIISIDTLKQDSQYTVHIENAYWDIIIIDEAHNVADRGPGALRNKLARLLAKRSDTLIMLSATPHDGRAKSFASLMNMLDPTAIANPDSYGKEDIKGLFIRRFKKDIQDQVKDVFRERQISVVHCDASDMEEEVYEFFAAMKLNAIEPTRKNRANSGILFKTTLEKSLFSSPAACIQTVANRLKRMEKYDPDEKTGSDRNTLSILKEKCERITPRYFSKYQRLLSVIKDKDHGMAWTPDDPQDRLVIFTERLETLRFLRQNLVDDLGLKDKQVAVLTGEMPDTEQQRIVEDFGKDNEPIRLLIASDVASEGINLHFLCHRMIHFDIPWSLMVFQQRNGRIDRYGQKNKPRILYLVTASRVEKIKGDTRILEILIEKDEQAARNIGDPSVFMKVYDIDEEERFTAGAIESGKGAEAFEETLDKNNEEIDIWDIFMTGDDEEPVTPKNPTSYIKHAPSIFRDNYAFLKAGIEFYKEREPLQAVFDDERQTVDITLNDALRRRFRGLPREIITGDHVFSLSPDIARIQKEIQRARKEEVAWPRIHYLWELNPAMEWICDFVTAAFGRLQAPVLIVPRALEPGETVFVVSGLIPNRKSHPLLHFWNGVSFIHGEFDHIEPFEELLKRTGLGTKDLPNPGYDKVPPRITQLLPAAVEKIREWMKGRRKEFEETINEKLNFHLQELERLRDKQFRQLQADFDDKTRLPAMKVSMTEKKERKRREIETIFDEYMQWIEDSVDMI
jgi:superfamily II DNA or RNA helicase